MKRRKILVFSEILLTIISFLKVFNDYDRELIGLRDYIEDRGHKQYYYDGMITIIFGIISITSYCTAKHIGNKIEFQDKLEMEKILSEQI